MNIGEANSSEVMQTSVRELSASKAREVSPVVKSTENNRINELKVTVDKDKEVKKIELEGIDKMVESVNKDVNPINTKLEFSVHEKTNRVLVKIIDSDTDEIVKEIPPEKLIDIKANLLEAAGILIDSKA